MHVLHIVRKAFKSNHGTVGCSVDNDWAVLDIAKVISKPPLALAYLLAEHCEQNWKLDFARLPLILFSSAGRAKGGVGRHTCGPLTENNFD